MTRVNVPITVGRGTELRCRGWRQEGLLRMLENTIANGERPQELIIYAGTGKAARNWECYRRIVASLTSLAEDETLLIQSGKPVAVMKTDRHCPRVLTANTNLVGKWATWEHYRELEAKGLMMYGQYTAGTWAYIGTQGILQGTYETFGACASQRFGGSLAGKLVLTAGLGGMGGAQPLAVKMAGGVCMAVEIDAAKAERRIAAGYCDVMARSIEEGLALAKAAMAEGKPLGIAVIANAIDTHERLIAMGVQPDIVTDQTSAHDPLNGFVPQGYDLSRWIELRRSDPKRVIADAMASMARHMRSLLTFQDRGAIVFEYGNNLRGHAQEAGEARAFEVHGFVPMFIRPSFCRGRGPFRWVCLSGDAEDLAVTDAAVMAEFPDDHLLQTWMRMALELVKIQNLPARTCWLGYGERDRFGRVLNRLVREGKVKAPIAMSRDHLDSGSVAQPTRETERMKDGSDAVADWPLLNALLNAGSGADLVSIHQGGGSGMGGSISAGVTLIADGSAEADGRITRSLSADPGLGIVRHADAGYDEALAAKAAGGIRMPMLDG